VHDSKHRRSLSLLALVLAMVLTTPACAVHRHRVGAGPGGHGETSLRQYYWMWGLLPINEADSQRLAGAQSGYEIVTKYSFVDILLAPVLFPFTVTTRTVLVKL
jgi:hypothetical protein